MLTNRREEVMHAACRQARMQANRQAGKHQRSLTGTQAGGRTNRQAYIYNVDPRYSRRPAR